MNRRMPNAVSPSREDEEYGAVTVVERSRLYFVAPIAIIGIVFLNLIWEVIRSNVGSRLISEWPFRFTMIDAATTATILAVFVSLFMGRLQWARALRPGIGSAIDDEGAVFHPDSDIWRFWLYNAGPGGGVIVKIEYYVRFMDQPESDAAVNWVPVSVVNDQLKSRGLVDGVDYFLRWFASGAPFAVVQHYADGTRLAWFTIRTLCHLRVLDVRVTFMDSLGDTYQKTVPIVHRLPSVTADAIRAARAKSGAQRP